MVSIYDLKPKFQRLLRPLCIKLAHIGVTANQVTIGALVLSFFYGGVLIWQPEALWVLLMLPVVLFVRMSLNAIDGMLARELNMKSRRGAVLNEMGDVLSDAFLYLPLALHPAIDLWLIVGIVLLGTMVEMMGVVAIQIGGSRRYDGPFGKSDRAFAFGLLTILLGSSVQTGPWISWYLWVAFILSGLTMINRGKKALLETND